jgi:quercetin 2,3-dioxygenase
MTTLLPTRARRSVGAWCLLDHVGPVQGRATEGAESSPHPHVGVQVVTWLFEGQVVHHDSLGSEQPVRPGRLAVLTAGRGVCHAEVPASDDPSRVHGVRLWACLPDGVRDTAPAFHHLTDLPTYSERGVTLTVLTGSLAGEASTAPVFTPLLAAEVRMRPGSDALLASHLVDTTGQARG